MQPILRVERERRQNIVTGRYREAVPLVKGGVRAVLLRPEVVDAWSWILLRASLDIGEHPNDESVLVTSTLSTLEDVAALIARPGARVALPEGYSADFQPVPTVEFWKSHVTGEPLPNPWTTEDMDDQMFVRKTLGEAFASELEIAARGGRSYREEFGRRAEAQLAERIKDFPADAFNPWIEAYAADDRSLEGLAWHDRRAAEIRRLQKENPPLNEWLKKIAAPLRLNPYETVGRDMTKEMMILKVDGAFAKHLRRTAAWKSSQLHHEALEAEQSAIEARRAADAAKQRVASQRRG